MELADLIEFSAVLYISNKRESFEVSTLIICVGREEFEYVYQRINAAKKLDCSIRLGTSTYNDN